MAWLDYKELITQIKRDPFIRTVLIVDYDGLSCYGRTYEEVLENTVVLRNVS